MPLRMQTTVAGPRASAPGSFGSKVTMAAAVTNVLPASPYSQNTIQASPLLNSIMMNAGVFGLAKSGLVDSTTGTFLQKVMTSLGGAAQAEGSFGPSNLGY